VSEERSEQQSNHRHHDEDWSETIMSDEHAGVFFCTTTEMRRGIPDEEWIHS
jgi:hypothetical protein